MGYELRVSSIVLFPDLQSICELFAHPKFELPPVAVDGHLAVHLPDRSILQRLGPWGYPWLEVVESQVRSAAPCHVLKHSNENPAILSPGLQHQLFTLTSHHLLSCISIHVGTI